jgi:hypothetical protein
MDANTVTPGPATLPADPAYTVAVTTLVARVNGFVYAGDRFNAVVDTLRHLRADPQLAATLLAMEEDHNAR